MTTWTRPCSSSLYHGAPIVMTKRFDLVMEHKQDGRTYIWDHKVTGAGVGKSRATQYSMDGQFAVNRIAGRQMWENFGGVVLNLVQRRDPFTVSRQFVPPTPWRDKKAHALSSLLASTMAGQAGEGDWEMAQSELVCHHRYGQCGAYSLCAYCS